MENFLQSILNPLYARIGLSGWQSCTADQIIALAAAIVFIFAVWKINSIIFEKILPRRLGKKGSIWAEALTQTGFLRRASYLIPAFTAYIIVPLIGSSNIAIITGRIVLAFIAGISAYIAAGFLDVVRFIYGNSANERAKRIPIKGYFQFIKIFLYIIGGILIVTSIMNVSPLGILSGIGALSAVLMLIFKDLILGFVASIQLSSSDIVRIGDSIEMPKYNAGGEVIDITLQSVVVRNWDLTISTIPIYSFISDSFRNWRGVNEGQKGRVKCSLYIDMDSVHFLSLSEITALSKIPLLSEHICLKLDEINASNKENGLPPGNFTLERQLTNLGVFRIYIELYIKSLSILAPNMSFVVSQQQPAATGLPLEVYFFCIDKSWINHESIQAGIFDHLLAIIKEFDLRVYQNMGAADLRFLGERIHNTGG
ncbi:MAG: mechanosensitive ion channel family protein [Spirochaetaceae bacterium]|jgi:miniconductance mechanosensitive channel|nr:mechanosensitive ion channel family protein [Spirochaetaceae bacterium]